MIFPKLQAQQLENLLGLARSVGHQKSDVSLLLWFRLHWNDVLKTRKKKNEPQSSLYLKC